MAVVIVRDGERRIEDVSEIRAFLKPYGIWYENWNVGDRVNPDADSAEILAAYAPEIDRLKAQGGYVTADVINVTSATPNLDAMLAKFSKEHTHSEDEVRFIVKGRGVFHVNPKNDDPVFAINVEAGDLINVP
ncbi:MAG TPA: acireductone dioxygenase, partial [Pirellulales bacterium]